MAVKAVPPSFQMTLPVARSIRKTAFKCRMDTKTSPKYGLEESSSTATELQW